MINLKTALLPHQQDAVEKLKGLKVGALYMEQGTGKTRTALSLLKPRLDAGKVDCVLWLCPCSVRQNLRDDIAFHCGEYPSEIVIKGIESLSSSDRLYLMLLKLVEAHGVYLVVDESNLVKNKDAIRTARIIELSKHCQYKLILNGTPISRNEADLFAQWYILDWRILGYQSYYSFAANHLEYYTIVMPDGREIVDRNRIRRVLNVDYLTEKIAPYTYQVKKDECLKLPEKEYRTVYYDLTDEQKELYKAAKEVYLENVDELKPETIYKYFTALQHVTSGQRLMTGPDERMQTEPLFVNPIDNPRIKTLFEYLDGIGDDKCIIFCKYQSEIDDISVIMESRDMRYVTFTGRVPGKARQANREAFQTWAQYFLSNKSCGAYGLNLQFCRRIIYYSNDFDLATRLQSEDRIHRIGQTREVLITDICADSTIDRFITSCLIRKERLADAFKKELHERKMEGMKYGKINIGFNRKQKEEAIGMYTAEHPEIKHIIVFYPDKWEHLGIEAEYIPYSEIIMYRTFYPLLEKIDSTYLLVYDECMRTKNRNDLTYNCAHKYNNQTEHVMVFEFFPFIEEPEEFMILADMIDHVRMKGRHYDGSVLDEIPTVSAGHDIKLDRMDVAIPDGAAEKYEREKTKLFENIGKKDPDTVPNALEIFVGKWKKPDFEGEYVARNKRYKADNVSTFAEHKPRKEAVLIDLPLRRRDFNDFVKLSGCKEMKFMHTGLGVDNFLFDRYSAWIKEVTAFDENAGLHKRKRG